MAERKEFLSKEEFRACMRFFLITAQKKIYSKGIGGTIDGTPHNRDNQCHTGDNSLSKIWKKTWSKNIDRYTEVDGKWFDKGLVCIHFANGNTRNKNYAWGMATIHFCLDNVNESNPGYLLEFRLETNKKESYSHEIIGLKCYYFYAGANGEHGNKNSHDYNDNEIKNFVISHNPDNEILDKLYDFTKTKMGEITIMNNNKINLEDMNNKMINLLKANNNLILTGAPGTGKTFMAKDVAEKMIFNTVSSDKKDQAEKLKTSPQFKLVQFHPAYTYEDFVRGVVVDTSKGSLAYKTVNKTLGEFAEAAAKDNKKNPYVLIIDEINRANLPAVLGELIYALEYRGETVQSMYALDVPDKSGKPEKDSGEPDKDYDLVLPENLYIIGTMNTADRSVGQIDYAIRRRFAFVECLPKDLSNSLPIGKKFESDLFKDVSALFIENVDDYIKDNNTTLKKSAFLSAEFRPEDVWIGHSYFITDDKKTKDYRLKYEIKPILKEYLKDGILTSAAEDKINELK
jgi:MoxR-like ATPase